jgi:O-antigen/teichoic acid export membrane protein
MLRVSAPVGVSQMLANLILRLDVLVVNGLFSATVVGYFAAANNAVVVMYVCSWLFGSVLLPDLVRHYADSSDRLDSFVRKWVRMVCLATVPATLALAAASPLLIRTLYGPSFAPAGAPLAIMSLALPLILINSLLFNRAVATQSRPVYVGAYVVAAIAALVLNLVCGLAFGVVGVAGAIVAREALQALAFVLSGRIVSRAVSPSSIPAVAFEEVASD